MQKLSLCRSFETHHYVPAQGQKDHDVVGNPGEFLRQQTPSDGDLNDEFGFSVAMIDSSILVGGVFNGPGATFAPGVCAYGQIDYEETNKPITGDVKVD